MHELVTALRLAGPDVRAAIVERFRPQIEQLLAEYSGLPAHVVGKVLADGGFDPVGYFAEGGAYEDDLFIRAARVGDPVAAAHIVGRRGVDHPATREVLAHVTDPGDPAWHTDTGLTRKLRAAARVDPLAAASWPFPETLVEVAVDNCKYMPYAVAIDLCVAVADRCGADALRELAGQDLGHEGLAAALTAAADSGSPSAHLADLRPAAEWTDAAAVRALALVRQDVKPVDRDAELPPLDWDLVRLEHRRRPFRRALVRLTRWPDCPDDILNLALDQARTMVVDWAARFPFDAIEHPKLVDDDQLYRKLFSRGVREGWLPLERLLTEARPAGRILGALPYEEDTTVGDAVAAVCEPLGADPENWLTFYSRLSRHDGTVAGLVADVASGKGKRVTRFPRPLGAVFPATPPENHRATLRRLLRAVPVEVTVALAPHLDMRTVQQLLSSSWLSAEARDALVAAHGSAALAAYAANEVLDRDQIEWIMARNDPAADGALCAHAPLTTADRVRILAGVRTDGSRGPVPEPVLDALREANLGHYRHKVTAGLSSGDLGVARIIAGRLRLGTEGGRLRLLLAVWERHGPDAVREILDLGRLPATTTKRVRKVLDEPDGLDTLRAWLRAEDDPDEFVARLGKKTGNAYERLNKLTSEGMDPPWDVLTAAADADRLTKEAVAALVNRHDCTREFARATLRYVLRNGELPPTSWRETLLRRGLTPADLLADAPQPARYLSLVSFDRRYKGRPRSWTEPCAEARALVDEHLGDDPSAWTVALHLFPEFTGTLPELLALARSAAH